MPSNFTKEQEKKNYNKKGESQNPCRLSQRQKKMSRINGRKEQHIESWVTA